MPLTPVSPFTRAAFLADVTPFISWAVDYVASAQIGGRTSWLSHFHSYEWNGADWRRGLEQRRLMARGLAEATQPELTSAIGDIVDWGRLNPLTERDVSAIAGSLDHLDAIRDESRDSRGLFARRIATTSKVYAMHDLETWAIYDSRVGYALAQLTARWWSRVGDKLQASRIGLPVPPERPPQRALPSGFPRLSSERQARLAFIYASWVLSAMADVLSRSGAQPEPGGWRTVHVEMALFMMGARQVGWPAMEGSGPSSEGESDDSGRKPPGSEHAAEIADKVIELLEESGLDEFQKQTAAIWDRERAIRFARETDCKAQRLQFADGLQRWVVFKDGRPIASFPAYENGSLEEALANHDADRLKPLDADSLRDAGRLSRFRGFAERQFREFWDGRRSAATEGLIERLGEDANPEKRRQAADALARQKDHRAAGALIAALHDRNKDVRAAAAHSLGVLGDPRADGALLRLLGDKAVAVRIQAATALGAVRGDDSLEPLSNLLADRADKPQVRAAAAIGLAALRDPAAMQVLIDAVGERVDASSRSQREVPAQAAIAIGLLGDEEGLPALLDALSDRDPTVRVAAATALGFLGSEAAIKPLEGALDTENDQAVIKTTYAALDLIAPGGANDAND